MLGKTLTFVAVVAGASLIVGLGVSWKLGAGADWNGAAMVRWMPWVLLLGAGSYSSRFLRWHTLVRQLAPDLRIGASLRTYMAGFAMGLTPGRLGEFCKFAILRQETGIPEVRSAPIFPLERATEAASFAGLAALGALLGHFQPAKLGGGALVAILAVPALAVLALALRFVARRSGNQRRSNGSWLKQLALGVQSVAGPRPLALALVCAGLARCFDASMFWAATRAAGLQISMPASALAFGIAGLTGGVSLLPAGVGAVESSLVATVSALAGKPAAALLAALLARCATLWLWVPAGLWFAFRKSIITPQARSTEQFIAEPVLVTAETPPERRELR